MFDGMFDVGLSEELIDGNVPYISFWLVILVPINGWHHISIATGTNS